MFDFLDRTLLKWLTNTNVASQKTTYIIYYAILIIAVLGISFLLLVISKKLFKRWGKKLADRTSNTFDDELYSNNFFTKLSLLIPLTFCDKLIKLISSHYSITLGFFNALIKALYVIAFLLLIFTLLDVWNYRYKNKNFGSGRSITNIVQAIKIFLSIICFFIVLSLLFKIKTSKILTALGASSAVLMLVFKDTILGFVAGIQLAFNKMVLVGDWIVMPSHGADGIVIEISLITVKVQNWNKTVTTIPTYSMISESVTNYRYMRESGTRMITRSVYIDASTVKFCDEELMERLKKVDYIKKYLDDKATEISSYNSDCHTDTSVVINGRRQTNLGIFRAYIFYYLKNSPHIDNNSDLLVRQKQSTNYGIPLEIYAYTSTSSFIPYENIQSDIFDHIFASIEYFDLKIFQSPAGKDLLHP
ncbi:MAG: mechanosensitive ion channel [Bacteroidales bacterium]|nr:mechanosensitive ion channel [Bacteroidales bacterium]